MPAAHAADNAVKFLPPEEIAKHQDALNRVQDYLSSLTTVISDFTQEAPDGAISTGKFYMSRPGKMRWQYNPPTPILMVANGGNELIYYDSELQQVTHVPMGDTLVGFLAQDKIRFNTKDIGIVEIEDAADVIRITIAQTKKPGDGQLMLELSDHPLMLHNMVVRDATNQVTTVSLSNAQFGVPISRELFIFQGPKELHKH